MPTPTAHAGRITPFRHLWHPRFHPLLASARQSLRRTWRRIAWPAPPATVLHVTHYKAGSQWILRILYELAEPWVVPPQADGEQFLSRPVRAGRVYPTLYATREQVERIRDLRDTLVSAYFSLKVSHSAVDSHVAGYREVLKSVDTEKALLRMIRGWCKPVAEIQQSWLSAGEEVVRYEDLLTRDEEILERVLLAHCRLPVSREQLLAVVRANRFEARSGRKPGQENVTSHERKGVAGDWRNHFTDKVAKAFKEQYGELLVATGYETDDRW
jgi:hypothetical protein